MGLFWAFPLLKLFLSWNWNSSSRNNAGPRFKLITYPTMSGCTTCYATVAGYIRIWCVMLEEAGISAELVEYVFQIFINIMTYYWHSIWHQFSLYILINIVFILAFLCKFLQSLIFDIKNLIMYFEIHLKFCISNCMH